MNLVTQAQPKAPKARPAKSAQLPDRVGVEAGYSMLRMKLQIVHDSLVKGEPKLVLRPLALLRASVLMHASLRARLEASRLIGSGGLSPMALDGAESAALAEEAMHLHALIDLACVEIEQLPELPDADDAMQSTWRFAKKWTDEVRRTLSYGHKTH